MTGTRALVVCSGGLDSTTAASHAKFVDGCDVTLLHFTYGCKAQFPEVDSVRKVSNFLGVPARYEDMGWLGRLGGSTLTEATGVVTQNERGAEYAHEWVPARNLLMIATAAAICDAEDYKRIYLGLNLEESAAYPDNTIEFYEKLNAVMPLAARSQPVIHNPLARMMKWQIVKHAYVIGAPIHLSWSCYLGGDLHCGTCGPCYMRKQAHAMNGVADTVQYQSDS